MIIGVITWFYLTDRPANANWLADDERRWLQDRLVAEQKTRESKCSLAWRQTLLNPRIIGLAFVYMSITVSLYGLSFFLPQMVKAFGTGDIASGFVVAFPYVIGAICMVLWGRFSDRIKERKWMTIVPLLMIAVGLGTAAYTDGLTGKISRSASAPSACSRPSRCSGLCRRLSSAARRPPPASPGSIPSAISAAISARKFSAT